MTPKDKAKELIEKYLKLDIEIGGQYDGYLTMKMHDAKQCALIAVDEILEVVKFYEEKNGRLLIDNIRVMYWQEVKQEIENL
jgi:hypothetical protein